MKRIFIALALSGMVASVFAGHAPITHEKDARYCGQPKRDAKGVIIRSAAQVRKFVQVFPCPTTLLHIRACKGWDVDHVIPMASGGCDTPINMQWLPNTIKNCTASDCKDRWERLYHGVDGINRQKVVP